MDIKVKKRAERIAKGVPPDSSIEVHHIIPKYAGGTGDESNAIGATRPEHAFLHFSETHDPKPKENTHAEWAATRHVIERMNIDEFTDFLGLVEPMIPILRSDLQKKRRL